VDVERPPVIPSPPGPAPPELLDTPPELLPLSAAFPVLAAGEEHPMATIAIT